MKKNMRKGTMRKWLYILILVVVLRYGEVVVDKVEDVLNPADEPPRVEEGTLDVNPATEEEDAVEYIVVDEDDDEDLSEPVFRYEALPEYEGEPFTFVNDNEPFFSDEQKLFAKENLYAFYGELDHLGRPTLTQASITKRTLPTKERGDISSVIPTGFIQNNYEDLINGGWLYNRSHLIGHQFTGEDANPKNLITGTRYFNVTGMYPFEEMVADYVKQNDDKHVLYRVTPIFLDDELVARGVLMEARSVGKEDDRILSYNVFIYNVQPGIAIDYATGENEIEP